MTLAAKFGVSTPFDPQHAFVTSPVFTPPVLAFVRLVMAFYTLFTLIFILVREYVVSDTHTFFSYFTHLSLIGLCAYFFAAALQTSVYSYGSRKGYPLQRWPKALQFLHVLLHSTIVTFPILVTIVYWALLADGSIFKSSYSAWSNVSEHILNTVFVLFEICFTHSKPSPWLHIPILVLILLGYLGIAYITRATQGFYTYSFLDPNKQRAKLAIYIVGIPAALVIIFILVRYITRLRERVFSTLVRRKASAGEKMEDWQDIERPKTPLAL